MKSCLTTLTALVISFFVHGQMVYYDAVLLKQKLVNNKFITPDVNCQANPNNASCKAFAELTSIFESYVPEDKRKNPLDILAHLQLRNPFLKDLIVIPTSQSGDFASLVSGSLASSSSAGTPQGLTTKIVDGLAKFLVKRTKEELTTAFFEDFNRVLEEQKDLQKLFPSTFQILRTATTEIFNYQAYLPTLRESFEYDLDNFFANAYEWTKTIEGPVIQKVLTKQKLYVSLKTSFYIGRELDLGTHPGEVLKSLVHLNSDSATTETDSLKLSELHQNLFPLLKTTDLFSQALRSENTERYWITENEFSAFRDPMFVRIFFGLLFQQLILDKNQIEFTTSGNSKVLFSKVLGDAAEKANALQAMVRSFEAKFVGIEKQIEAIRNTPDRNHADYVRVAKDMFGLINVASTGDSINLSFIRVPSSVTFYAEHFSALWSYIQAKSYNSAVFEAYAILDSAIAGQDDKKTLKAFLKYGTFMASVATAENSDEVALAIEAIVLPPGSASIKRKSEKNISLNAYVGLSPGYEWRDSPVDNGGFVFSVSAPIGLAFSKGKYSGPTNGKYRERGSQTWFISLVDLGAVTAYRFDEETAVLPELKFSNIFAPGLYYVRGLPNYPISLGLGGQLGPQLREVADSTATLDDSLSISFKFFVAVDIPLLNFYTKSR